MSYVIKLSPETEARLKQASESQNLPIAELLRQIVEQSSFGTASNTKQSGNGAGETPRPKRNIMDFEGIGAANASKRDAQERINELRDEWDAPS